MRKGGRRAGGWTEGEIGGRERRKVGVGRKGGMEREREEEGRAEEGRAGGWRMDKEERGRGERQDKWRVGYLHKRGVTRCACFHCTRNIELIYSTVCYTSPDDDAIINGEAVIGQPSNVPLPDLDLVTEGGTQREVLRTRDVSLSAHAAPVPDLVLQESTNSHCLVYNCKSNWF